MKLEDYLIPKMDVIRTFIAVEIPANIRQKLAEVSDELSRLGVDAKWVPKENFHITLKFLGNVKAELIANVSEVVKSVVDQTSSFDIALAGLGAFPRLSRPSVVWVGISEGTSEIKSLAEHIDSKLVNLGFEREARPFSGHVTLARIRTLKNIDKLREKIEILKDQYIGAFGVKSVVVMKSDLQRTGPIYTPISEFELQN